MRPADQQKLEIGMPARLKLYFSLLLVLFVLAP